MIVLDVEQGSSAWRDARCGIPTASSFGKIVTPAKLTRSSQAETYRNQLVAERLLGHPLEWGESNPWMDRGTAMEPEARGYYEIAYGARVQVVGLVLREDRKAGGSPDGLVGESGGLEIKCPALHTHVGYLLDPKSLYAAYALQVQGYLYLTGREWWDVLSYCPSMPDVRYTAQRDERVISALAEHLDAFVAEVEAAHELLQARFA